MFICTLCRKSIDGHPQTFNSTDYFCGYCYGFFVVSDADLYDEACFARIPSVSAMEREYIRNVHGVNN